MITLLRRGRRALPVALTGLLFLSASPAAVRPGRGLPPRSSLAFKGEAMEWRAWRENSERLRARDRRVLEDELRRADRSRPLLPKKAPNFRMPAKPPAWFAGEEARRMAEAVISFQTPSGGWVKNTEMTKRARRMAERWAPWDDWRYTATIDNGATTGQIAFLARVFAAGGDPDCGAAARRGLEYLLAAQGPSGGWPQVFPLQGGYHDYVTFNDNAMTGVLRLLRDVGKRRGAWRATADTELARRARSAVERGVKYILASQIRIDGRRTVWCAQHDPVTLEPRPARRYEKASLSGGESAGITRFLMSLERPDAEVISAVEGAVQWFESARLNPRNFGDKRSRLSSGWARFYDLNTGRPLFSDPAGHEGDSLKDAGKKKRTYQWFTDDPARLVEKEYPRWRAGTARQ